jgi:diacylglycerol kinase (ATP)
VAGRFARHDIGLTREVSSVKERRGIVRAIKAAEYSCRGLAAAWRHEEAFRQEVVLALLMAPLAFVIADGFSERGLLLGSLLLVLVVELINSALEAITDRIGREHHELSRRAKDMGSAAVMLALVLAGGLWLAKSAIFLGLL